MKENRDHKNYLVQTVQRAIQVLRAFSKENSSLSLTEINKITGIGVPSLQRLLYTLVHEGLLIRNEDDKKYELGLEFVVFAEIVRETSNLLLAAEPVMKKLNEKTTESVTLNIIENNKRKCISSFDSKHELTTLSYVGHQSPLYAGASAKVLLAHFPEEELEEYLNNVHIEKLTDSTITDLDQLREELRKIREQGYAFSYGERVKGAVSISAPIFDSFSNVIASLSITIPSVRFGDYDREELIKETITMANEITEKLAHRSPKR